MTTKDRLKMFVSSLGLGRNKFETLLGLSNGYISSKSSAISSDVIEKIAFAYPDLSLEWLLRGKGDMFKPQQELSTKPQPIKTSGNSESKYESESESINIDLQEEQIDSNRMIKKLIEALELYQIRVDKLLDTVESLQNENAKLKSLLEKQKTS